MKKIGGYPHNGYPTNMDTGQIFIPRIGYEGATTRTLPALLTSLITSLKLFTDFQTNKYINFILLIHTNKYTYSFTQIYIYLFLHSPPNSSLHQIHLFIILTLLFLISASSNPLRRYLFLPSVTKDEISGEGCVCSANLRRFARTYLEKWGRVIFSENEDICEENQNISSIVSTPTLFFFSFPLFHFFPFSVWLELFPLTFFTMLSCTCVV